MRQPKEIRSLEVLPYKALMLLMRLLALSSLVLIVIFLLPLALPYMKNAMSFQYIRKSMDIERSMRLFVQNYIPTKIAGQDLTRWIMITLSTVLFFYATKLRKYFRNKAANVKIMKDYEKWKAQFQVPDDSKILAPLREKMQTLQTVDKKDREELLRLFAETKRKLDTMGKDLAFLAIDVVDSTGIKEGEDKAIIEYDFKSYKNFVEEKLKLNGVIKSTWTPDGVMCCFKTVDSAAKAARDVIHGLEDFNKHVKTLKRDFRVRCGINAGYVYFDESLPLEEMSDRVIDVAGHMQKQAAHNSICIAKPAIEPLQDRSGFAPVNKTVDGYDVYVWDRRAFPRE